MKSTTRPHGLLAAVLAAGAITAAAPASAQDIDLGVLNEHQPNEHARHDRPSVLGTERRALRKQALQELMAGQTPSNGKVHQVASGLFVELEREAEDPIWTVLGEFGPQPSPYFGGAPGPQHNQIPEPDRATDNVTHWVSDFNQAHFENMLFNDGPGANSMHNYYVEQSSGRYSVRGAVEDWVQVPFNASHYGSNWCGDKVCATTWWFIEDTLTGWYNNQLAAGKTPAEIDEYLSQYDVWDRYDYDGDGNFDEPDGYIDHFQAVHSGRGEEDGGGDQGEDAIWSHRWYVQLVGIYEGGPTVGETVVPFGGVRIGGSKYWVGDYTIEPENGGVGVFSHEFGHDHGLPDLYDTSGGGSNSVQFWSLMSAGSWTSDGSVDIGTKPTHMGAWEKLQLGWLNYDLAFAGEKSVHTLGPAENNTRKAQALIVLLPNKVTEVNVGTPYEGERMFHSTSGDNLDVYMYDVATIGPGSTLTAQVDYDIEPDWDYAYAFAFSELYGFVALDTNVSTTDDPNGQNFGNGITGNSGGWVGLNADLGWLPAGDWLVGFNYWTDGYVQHRGLLVDNVQVTGGAIDGAETSATTMTLDGFVTTTGSGTVESFNAYIAEFRQYRGYDEALRTGPYNFYAYYGSGWNMVEHFPYQDGLLVSYWDELYTDNNTSQHPGGGLILPIDANPEPLVLTGYGVPWPTNYQTLDSTFHVDPTDDVTLTFAGIPFHYPSHAGVSVFDDNNQYWNPATPTAGVMNPHTDTQIVIRGTAALGTLMTVMVR